MWENCNYLSRPGRKTDEILKILFREDGKKNNAKYMLVERFPSQYSWRGPALHAGPVFCALLSTLAHPDLSCVKTTLVYRDCSHYSAVIVVVAALIHAICLWSTRSLDSCTILHVVEPKNTTLVCLSCRRFSRLMGWTRRMVFILYWRMLFRSAW